MTSNKDFPPLQAPRRTLSLTQPQPRDVLPVFHSPHYVCSIPSRNRARRLIKERIGWVSGRKGREWNRQDNDDKLVRFSVIAVGEEDFPACMYGVVLRVRRIGIAVESADKRRDPAGSLSVGVWTWRHQPIVLATTTGTIHQMMLMMSLLVFCLTIWCG